MDDYSQLLLFFYRKVSMRHPKKNALIRKLQSLVKKCQMAETHIEDHSHLLKIQNDQSADRLTQAEKNILRKGVSEWGIEPLFVSHSFEKTVLFAIINRLIQTQDFLSFKCLEQKLNMQLEDSNFCEDLLRVTSYEWFKIGQILLHKNRIKWEKLLSEAIHNIPTDFDALFTKNFEGQNQNGSKKQQILNEVSTYLKTKILFCEMEGTRMLSKQFYGVGQTQIVICYFYEIDRYIICSKAPQLSEQAKLKQQTLNQLQLGFESLVQQYCQGTASMCQLSSLSEMKLNQWKIMAYLGKK